MTLLRRAMLRKKEFPAASGHALPEAGRAVIADTCLAQARVRVQRGVTALVPRAVAADVGIAFERAAAGTRRP